jgi:hypothetical protein
MSAAMISMDAPFAGLQEYVGVQRAALWASTVDHHRRFCTAKMKRNHIADRRADAAQMALKRVIGSWEYAHAPHDEPQRAS